MLSCTSRHPRTWVNRSQPAKYFRNNVESGLSLLDAVLSSPVRMFVFSSSCAIYGIPRQLPIAEDCPQEPVNPYGASKLFLEHALAAYRRVYGLGCAAIRYFNTGGVIQMEPSVNMMTQRHI